MNLRRSNTSNKLEKINQIAMTQCLVEYDMSNGSHDYLIMEYETIIQLRTLGLQTSTAEITSLF